LGILLTQDILIVPMLIGVNYLSGHVPPTDEIIRQLVGGAILVVILLGMLRGKKVRLPFAKAMLRDHELQVFVGLILCFGFALFTAIMGLSAALGAFVAGMIVHASRSTRWFHETLHPFRVLFVSIFFVSVGMLISFRFIMENWQTLALVITAIYVTNHFINTLILRNFGSSWRESWYGGALLAQIGELSFVLSATGYSSGIFTDYVYQLTVAVIALTLFFSPFWIALTKKLCHYRHSSTLKPEKV
ncbi:MAG: cation:proton antiporter, partial [Bacteroidetes bacterium]